MAADGSPEWVSSLPWAWGYGISAGGRVFFINEEAKSTTWLHPVTGETILTGHRRTPDLPTGWEEAFTFEGARYYINHNERKVTCKHPVTALPSQDNCIFVVNDQAPPAMSSQENKDRAVSMTSDSSTCNAPGPAANPSSPVARASRTSGKVHNFGKRSNSIKRNPNAPVAMRGWLYKKANSGMKLWKKRWFVLSDLCLFYYRDEKEEGVLGSILLPSFQISGVTADDHVNRSCAFKAAHPNMRTYYFCTDSGKEAELWMGAMTAATLLHSEPIRRENVVKAEYVAPQEINHVANHRLLVRPEAQNNQRNKELSSRLEEAEKYGFQKEGQDRPLTKITGAKRHPATSDYKTYHHLNGPHLSHRAYAPHSEPDRLLQRTNSMQQLEQWIRSQRDKSPEEEEEEESAGVLSYQTLPRNMPSYRPQLVPRYPEGYKTLPRNPKPRPESVCSTAGVGYDRTVVPVATEEKRRSVRDDTMWQLYEWQQRQFYNKQTTLRRHSSLTSPKTMVHLSEQGLHPIPLSPSHGSISGYHTYSPHRAYRSELSSPVQRGDLTIERRPKPHANVLALMPDRRSVPAGLALQPVTPQALQGKTMAPEDYRPSAYKHRSEEADVDANLSRLCEQDKIVEALEQKLQQLHKEKYTLEQALLSASQEIELNTDDPSAAQTVELQRDDLQSGLLSTCREVSRATTELERSWRDYDKLEREVTGARNQLRERLERLGEVQTEAAGIQRAQMQKEIWRIQDVMEGLSKHKQQRPAGAPDPGVLSSGNSTNESPDYRLYKSEPELTTVAEVDESNGDDKTDLTLDMETSANKGSHFPVGVVPPRTKSPPMESTTIASYVTLRKSKKLENKSERPRSAVEHLCIAEGPRPRMTLEEQLERMRRHQAACLKEKKKGLTFLGSSDLSPAQSPSFSRENSLKLIQVRRREENAASGTIDRANIVQSQPQETTKEPAGADTPTVTANVKVGGAKNSPVITNMKPAGPAASCSANAKDDVTEEPAARRSPAEPELQEQCLQVVNSVLRRNAESEETPREEERGGILFYDFSADALRRHTALEEAPTLSVASAQPQLTEGSHFMCV